MVERICRLVAESGSATSGVRSGAWAAYMRAVASISVAVSTEGSGAGGSPNEEAGDFGADAANAADAVVAGGL